MHDKNQHALNNYKNIQITTIYSIHDIEKYDLTIFDCVYSPSEPINVALYPNTKFIFGPHFSVFPNEKLLLLKGYKNVIYNSLSEWVVNVWKSFEITHDLNILPIPFGIDTFKFDEIKPIQERKEIFIYMKSRNPNDLAFIQHFLEEKKISYTIFSYRNRYKEEDYLNYLKNAKYGIWLDAHESQGFALQEALSCNVPLFVWNVKSMNQEYRSNYQDFPATTIPYWDKRCGEFFHSSEEIESMFELFLSKLETYQPRKFILENVSMEACEKKLIEIINTIEL
jgi:hypothetical protein